MRGLSLTIDLLQCDRIDHVDMRTSLRPLQLVPNGKESNVFNEHDVGRILLSLSD